MLKYPSMMIKLISVLDVLLQVYKNN